MEAFASIESALSLIASVIAIGTFVLKPSLLNGRIARFVYIGVVCALVWFLANEWSLNARERRSEEAAAQLLADADWHYTDEGFVRAGLVFLERYDDLYPNAYAEARRRHNEWECDEPGSSGSDAETRCNDRYSYAASEMKGIIRAIAGASAPRSS
jgi:hypothetical protein